MTAACRWCLPGAIALLALVCGGCAKAPAPLYPVGGRVLYHNKPVAGLTIQFVPDLATDPEGRTASGQTDSTGTFRLATPPQGDGARKGTYRVTVAAYPGSKAVPARYSRHDTTNLTAQVPEGGDANLLLKLSD